MYSWLQGAVAQNGQVVTASRGLARELRSTYGDQQLEQGCEAWVTPSVDSLSGWLVRTLESADDPAQVPTYIDQHASAIVWEECLRRHLSDEALSLSGLVRHAQQAWRQACDWHLSLDEIGTFAGNDDQRLFAMAAKEYADKLKSAGWIDIAGLPGLLSQLAQDNLIPIPGTVLFVGFDRQTPSLSGLADSLTDAGASATFLAPANNNQTALRAEFSSAPEELRTAGAWARDQLRAAPMARIGIVVVGLKNVADASRRAVLEGIAPGWQRAGEARRNIVDVSYGQVLTDYPAVHVALTVLHWISDGVGSRDLSILLRSKMLSDGRTAVRSQLEYRLREWPDRRWSVSEFVRLAGSRVDGADLDSFLEALGEVQDLVKDLPERADTATWARHFDAVLAAIGWPGPESLDSNEFQLLNRWRQLLNEFANLQIVAPPMRAKSAVRRLSALAGETIYQPEAMPGAVQMVDEHAAGHEFDALWISGLDATQWPAPVRPTAFLSRALQKKYALPDSTPADTLAFAQQVLFRWVGSATNCVLSWASTREDVELTESPLLSDIDSSAFDGLPDPGWFAGRYLARNATSLIVDDPVPKVSSDERIRGGAYTVEFQSREPFSAFVRGRLGVQFPSRFAAGLSARHRGIVVHDALRNLYAAKPSQDTIVSWSEDTRSSYVGSAVDAALAELVAIGDPTLRRILSIERQRLRRLLLEFLDTESTRDNFSVYDVETEIEYRRGDVRLALRADRIDQMPDQQLVVIDYKTGTEQSFLNRHKEPANLQLVVYADALGERVGGLALFNIDSRRISHRGAGGSIAWGDFSADEWPDHLNVWRRQVHEAVDEFAQGDVRVNILAPANEARQTQLLSRVEELKRAE